MMSSLLMMSVKSIKGEEEVNGKRNNSQNREVNQGSRNVVHWRDRPSRQSVTPKGGLNT